MLSNLQFSSVSKVFWVFLRFSKKQKPILWRFNSSNTEDKAMIMHGFTLKTILNDLLIVYKIDDILQLLRRKLYIDHFAMRIAHHSCAGYYFSYKKNQAFKNK